ncbi:MAG: metallophosphoesterase [Bacteroidia bacterium]|nr:metallophosphoesterase [Bacteroidia bacterium]
MKLIVIIFPFLYLAGNYYVFAKALKLIGGLSFLGSYTTLAKIGFGILFWIAAFLMVICIFGRGLEIPPYIHRAMFAIGAVWLVFILYMVMALAVTDIAKLIFPWLKHSFAICFAFTCCILIYGWWNYHTPKVEKINITLDKKACSLAQDLKIVGISDIHLGYGTGKGQLKKYVELINSLKPDIILIAGDLIDNSLTPLYQENMQEELSMLKAPLGIYMALGNHEYISGVKKSCEFLGKTPIKVLRDTVVTLPNGVQIIGRDDRHNKQRKTLEELVSLTLPDNPLILLDHQPYELGKTDSLKIDLQLSGHTHRGQIWPISLLTDVMYEQSYGYKKWEHSHIYVSSGLSLWGPAFRIGTQSEIVLFTISHI